MANFKQALAITGQNEGGLSNDVNDKGKLTYMGIASKYWPNWKGWSIVRQVLTNCNGNFGLANRQLRENSVVQQLVTDFYKANFWDINKLDQVNDQQLANSVYDESVNAGVRTAAKMLQLCKSVDSGADGIIGSGTLEAVNDANPEILYNEFNSARRAYYEAIIDRDASQKVFEHSWLSRLTPYKKL